MRSPLRAVLSAASPPILQVADIEPLRPSDPPLAGPWYRVVRGPCEHLQHHGPSVFEHALATWRCGPGVFKEPRAARRRGPGIFKHARGVQRREPGIGKSPRAAQGRGPGPPDTHERRRAVDGRFEEPAGPRGWMGPGTETTASGALVRRPYRNISSSGARAFRPHRNISPSGARAFRHRAHLSVSYARTFRRRGGHSRSDPGGHLG